MQIVFEAQSLSSAALNKQKWCHNVRHCARRWR